MTLAQTKINLISTSPLRVPAHSLHQVEMDPKALRLQISEINARAEQIRAEEYRKLLVSLVNELEDNSASTSPASQAQSVPQPSSSLARDPDALWLAAPAPAPAPAPDRSVRPNRSSSREVVVEVPAVARTTSSARTDRPAPYGRAESVRGGVVPRGARVSASPGLATPRPTDRRLTRSQALTSLNDGPGSTNSRASTISTGSTDENEATNDAPNVPVAIQAILDGAGLAPYSLSWGENERADMTPGISRTTFSKIFGGFARSEWLECDSRPHYQHFLCADLIAQPFAPTHVGNRGLIIFFPAWADAPQDDDEEGRIFHAFVSARPMSALMKYVGDYTKVPLLQNNIQWSLLPPNCRRRWLKRLYSSRSSAGRAFRVRIKLRGILKREPSVAEVRERLRDGPVGEIPWRELLAALNSGEERHPSENAGYGIKCERYNAHLAVILSENGAK
ncbi:hypothetical protein BJY52DRAFT_1288567 [Lactarius psammicola]|nr:hypothetical protein BJY52DRAFT_1288567 [Lactarius psammicola]